MNRLVGVLPLLAVTSMGARVEPSTLTGGSEPVPVPDDGMRRLSFSISPMRAGTLQCPQHLRVGARSKRPHQFKT